ncbi:MAG TPA: hypothetical protein VLT45_09065 [Kofleriaceae bacterium]|nr:hypothetical protein [Kofleriaceae bacterium]
MRRILDRYVVEIVERFDLCPWAKSARLGGEVAIDVLWGEPSMEAWLEAGKAMLAQPGARIAMVVAPESALTVAELREVRDHVTRNVPQTGIAHFHPDAPLDLATPARLVPFLRRSPDPLLQLVPLALLESVRGAPMPVERAQQVQMLGGVGPMVRGDIADRIAEVNHARVSAEQAEVMRVLETIAQDRRASYARVGVHSAR